MKFQNLSVTRLFGWVAMELVLSMCGITIDVLLVTKQMAVLLTGGALLLCAIVGILVLTQAFGKRLSPFTTDLCQTLDHMSAGDVYKRQIPGRWRIPPSGRGGSAPEWRTDSRRRCPQ